MATAVLPRLLQTKMDELGARLRRLRLLRGVSLVVLALVGGAAIALILDYWLELPPVVRILLFTAWVACIGLAIWRGFVRPLRRPLTAANLAAAVEEEYPRLKERLSSSVELTESNDDFHGSRAFVHLLVRETDLKTRALDFRRAAPHATAEWSATGAVIALLLLSVPIILWPEGALGLGRRLLMPWDRRPAVLPFTIAVTPGDVFTAKGRPLTLTVELTPKEANLPLPTTCTLVLAPANGKSLRLRMPDANKPNMFAFRIDDVQDNYRYYVEAGNGESATFTITSVEPVELAAGFPIATLTPPAYAKSVPAEKVEGLGYLNVLQFGRVALDCRFTQPADGATLIWTPATSQTEPQRIPLKLAEDRLSASVTFPARESATLRLEFDAGHGVLTTPPAQGLVVTSDLAPMFRRVTGLPEHAEAKLADALSLGLTVADDLGVAAVEVEYRIDDGPIQHEPVPLTGLGTLQATGMFAFKLAGKAKEGDTVHVRFRATDTRDVPEANLGPNVTYFPAGDRWAELHVASAADSLRQQEVLAKRDELEKRLRDIIDQLAQNQRKLYRLHQEISRRQGDPKEHAEALQHLTESQDALTKKLTDFAMDAATAGLTPLADKARAVTDEELRQAGEALRDGTAQTGASRVAPLRRAEAATIQAHDKLESLLRDNRDLAKARLDEVKLRELAERERELAEKAEKATASEERQKLAEQQKALAEELRKLAQSDEKLQEALRAAQAEQARTLADKAAQLAQTERGIDEKLHEEERQRNAERLSGLADKQQQLAAEAARLARQTQASAEAARVPPLDANQAAKATDALRRGEAGDALNQQERTARELDKLADNLQHALDVSRDPRESAQQLRRMQEETRLHTRTNSTTREALQREEEAIRKAIDRLPLPQDSPAAHREQQQAAEKAAQATDKLQKNDLHAAQERMTDARDALDRLAKSLPNTEQRQRQAREDVAKLRKQQEEIGQQAERAARQQSPSDRAEAARKEADLAERLAKLDAPGQEERRDQAKQAAARALDDLFNKRDADVSASQGDARRALQRLDEALAGKTPADEKARELAREQRQLANDAAKSARDPAQQADLQRRQERIAREAQGVDATEAPVRQAEAVQSALQANQSLRDQPNDPSTADKVKGAADKLQQWADQLAGREANPERAERLAQKQEATAKTPPANSTDARRQANQIAEETKQVRAGETAAAEKKQALEAMNRLQQTPPESPGHADAEQAAAEALRKLADKVNDPKSAIAKNDAPPTPSPRDLARQQRDLASQTEAARGQSGSEQRQSLERAAANQKTLQEQAARLPAEQAPRAVQQAREAIDRAAQALNRNDPVQAAQQQRQAADALDQAAAQGEKSNAERRAAQQSNDNQAGAEQVNRAHDLAKQQRELRDQVQQMVGQPSQRPTGDAAAQAQKQQQQVSQQAGELAKGLDQSAGQMPNDPARNAAQEAARLAQRAEQSLQQAQTGSSSQDQSARRQAINALDQAARQADQASRAADPGSRRASPNGQPPAGDVGQAVQTAQSQMNQAQGQLSQGQRQAAQGSMQQAAQALDQAAQQMGQGNPGDGQRDSDRRPDGATRPATGAAPGHGDPTAADLPADAAKYAGKKWGELPGELRTRILQEMKAQYGDDYARVIKLYFEQIADNNASKKGPPR